MHRDDRFKYLNFSMFITVAIRNDELNDSRDPFY